MIIGISCKLCVKCFPNSRFQLCCCSFGKGNNQNGGKLERIFLIKQSVDDALCQNRRFSRASRSRNQHRFTAHTYGTALAVCPFWIKLTHSKVPLPQFICRLPDRPASFYSNGTDPFPCPDWIWRSGTHPHFPVSSPWSAHKPSSRRCASKNRIPPVKR